VVQPHAYERLLAALGTDAAIDAAADATIATYADYFFQYAGHLVTSETVQGQGCGCGSAGSRGVFSYSLSEIVNGIPDGPNVWRRRNVMTYPDGNQLLVYMNGFGQTMLEVFKEAATGLQWRKYYVYNADSSLASVAFPSAVTGHDEALPGLVSSAHLPDAAGLWRLFDYYATTNLPAGAVAKRMSAKRTRQGELGTSILLETHQFTSHTGSSGTVYPLSRSSAFRNTDGTGALNYDFAYSWQGSSNQILQKTTTYPIVPAGQNGSGAATSMTEQFDVFNRRTWLRDEDGFIHATEWDNLTGAVTKAIVDVNTALVTNEPAGWATPAGGGLHLTTTLQVDFLGRTTKLTDPAGDVTYTVYRDPQHEVRIYPGWIAATNTTTGPTRLKREDRRGSYHEDLTMSAAPAVTGGVPTGTEAVSSLQSLCREFLDTGDRTIRKDCYFNFSGLTYTTSTTLGTLGTHFYRELYNYDIKGRKDRLQDWTGTITRVVYDSRDRESSTWVGTDDTPTTGDWSPTNTAGTNLIKVAGKVYDGGGVGNDLLTKSRQFTSASVSLDKDYQYDFRNRLLQERQPDGVTVKRTLDNLNRVTLFQTYADANLNLVLDAGELREQEQPSYDERGMIYRQVITSVDPATGAAGNTMTDLLWWNGRGLPVKLKGANGEFRKFRFDGASRPTATLASFDDAETAYADALTLVGDTVIEQEVTDYDAAGNAIQTTIYRRTPSSVKTGDLSVTWSANDSRRTYKAFWFDAANRLTNIVDYGTNANAALARPATPPAPNSSPGALVFKIGYDAAGRESQHTDNLGRLSQMSFDGVGRATQLIENFVAGSPVETSLDTDRKTTFTYDSSGRLTQKTLFNPKGTGLGVQQQVTKLVYGTIANQAAPAVFRNDLKVAEIGPDSDDTYNPAGAAGSQLGAGADTVYDRTEFTYDYAGRRSTIKDPRGTVRTIAYDTKGRVLSDAVTTLPAGVDGAVRRREFAYDSLSRLLTETSFNAASAGTALNQVRYTYNGWGETTKREDAHGGTVVAGTPAVTVGYSEGTVSGASKYLRVSSVTYPNGRVVYLNYPASGAGDKISRPDNIANDAAGTTQFSQYVWMGVDTILDINHPLVANGLVFRQGPDNSPGGWDQFDRQIMTKWRNSANTLIHDQYTYTYDSASNRLTRKVGSTAVPAVKRDDFFAYDGLNRLTKQNRGQLAGAPLTIADASANFSQKWTLESEGNWRQLQVAPTGGGTYSFVQNRATNAANEIDTDANDANAAGASLSGSGGGDWIDPTYDKAGNLVSGPKVGAETTRQWMTYDAWNRLVLVRADAGGAPGATVAEFQYGADNRRIVKLVPNGVNWNRTDYYFALGWDCVEERTLLNSAVKTTVATVPRFQWVREITYLDAVVLRDENKDGNSSCTDAADQRLFYCTDASFSTTALVDTSGAVVERYVYDAYGKVTVLNGAWNAQAAPLQNEILLGGTRQDPETLLYDVRHRSYHPTLGTWLQRDPLETRPVMGSRYQYLLGNPSRYLDPSGLGEVRILAGAPDTSEPGATGHNNLGELLKGIKDNINSGECLKALELVGHANPWEMMLGPDNGRDNNSKSPKANKVDGSNAGYVGGELGKLDFCCPCYIYLSGCNTGLLKGKNTWPQIIADQTGCLVYASMGYKSGSVLKGNIEVKRKMGGHPPYGDDDDHFKGMDDKYRIYGPANPREPPCDCPPEESKKKSGGKSGKK
jgi:RHS repeat-associated protein